MNMPRLLPSPLCWFVAGFAALLRPGFADPVTVDGFSFVRSLGGIDEYRLDANGLQVLLKPDHTAPVATFMVTYRVGSRNEVTGTTGATHILEHMMFKGSDAFNDAKGNSIKQYLEQVGSSYNATTSIDRTNYFATVGRDALPGYMAIESDRMRGLWLHEADRQREMTVVRNEYERGENNPIGAVEKEIYATAFQAHPYHHSTIGWRSDIEKVPIEKLREFYDTFYWPDNATATLVGDFEPAAGLGLIKKYYGVYPKAPHPIPEMYTEEPAQTGPRRVVVKRYGQLGAVIIGHKIVSSRDADFPALEVLASILGDGKNSRLYRALVDQGLATSAQASADVARDGGLHEVFVLLTPGTKPETAEAAAVQEIERVRSGGVTADEVAAAIRRRHTANIFRRDGPGAIAASLNQWIAVGDWTLYVTLDEKIAQVTPVDVQRVAQKYLDPDQSTTGWFVPLVANGAKAAAASL
jgi:zinc protease